MRVNEKMRKALSILLCLCMLLQNAPVMAFAATTDNLCDHHTEHTAECGYREGSAGSACTHEHSEDCYAILECLHTCGEECADGCTHECTVENGCIFMELDCHHVHGGCGYSEGTAEIPCGHVHNESCGYVEAVAGNPCANAETDPECDHLGSCGYVAAVEGQPCGHTACDDTCGYAPATEGTPCTHVCEVKVDSDDSCYKLLCSHSSGGHDDACGYAEAVEAHECHYECAECANNELSSRTSPQTGVAIPEGDAQNQEIATSAPDGDLLAMTEAVCNCGTDDPAIHAVSCAVYVAPENPVCYCTEKCTEVNVWCDVCGFDYTACTGTDTAAAYAEATIIASGDCSAEGSSVQWKYDNTGTLTISGTGAMADYTSSARPWEDYCDSITTLVIKDGVTIIGASAFDGCTGLTSVKIPNSVTIIGYAAFGYCTGLTSIEIPSSVTTIGEFAFDRCIGLVSIEIPNSVTTIGNWAFDSCTGLKSVTIPSSVTEIGVDPFLGCTNVSTVIISCTPSDAVYGCIYPNLERAELIEEHAYANGVCTDCGEPCPGHTGGEATCTEKAVCTICGASYGEVGAHTAEPTYVPNAGDSTQHDATYSCCGATVTEAHTMNVTTGKCVCGADMTAIATVTDGTNTCYAADAATLNQAATAILETGSRTFTVELPADAEAGMITTIRRAICDTEGVADGSIHLTLKGVTTIPGTTNRDGVAFGPGDIYDEAGKIVDQELVTQLASINLPDVTEIGAQAFYFCENLVSVSAPKAQTIGAQAFGYTALTSVEFPELTTIPTDMFSGTWTLSSAKFPKVTTIEQSGLLVGAKFTPENNPTPFPLELTAEGNITFNGSNHFNIASQNYSGKVDLVLCCDKKDAVTFNEDGTATWQVREDLSYTFKSITFKHSYVNGKCTACGEDCTHTGGTATCTTLAVCDTCGVSYGAVDTTNHDSSVECENGFCPNGCYEPAILNAAGYYEIDNAGKLFWFAQQVNVKGNREIKGVLTANIDLENKPWTPIGVTGEENNNFRGVFDGQNYTIKGLYVEGSENGVGFFGEVRTGTVKNFRIYGNVVVNTEVNYVGGVIGSICGVNGETDLERNGAIIQNITSFVNVTAKVHGIGMIGGFVGYANHQSLIEKCAWYGTFDAGEYHVDSGAGGFIGKIQENTSEVTIRNCGAYGTIKTNYAGDYNNTATIYMGGFLSFSNTGAKTTIENCLFAGRFERGENLTDQAFLGAFGTLRSVNAIKNCYYLGDDGLEAVHSDSDLKPGSDNVEITSVTGEELRNNTIATQLGDHWMQDVHYPIPKDTKAHSDSATYTYTDNGDGTHKATCTECGYVEEVNEAHSGGTATCTEQAECQHCGASYGEVGGHSPDAAGYTVNADGTHSYTCSSCGNPFTERHTFTDGACTGCGVIGGYCGEEGNEQNVIWTYANGTLTVSGTGAMADQFDNYNNRPWEEYVDQITTIVVNDGITSIGEAAFWRFQKLTTAKLPDSLTTISQQAFYGCTALKTVNFPANLKTIEGWAFLGCALESVTLPEGLTTIGYWAFSECKNLTSVTVPASVTTIDEGAFGYSPAKITVAEDNLNYSSDEHGVLFDKDKTTLIYCRPNIEVETYTIPSTVTEICKEAFYGCKNLATITIPDGVQKIGSSAFGSCEALTTITIPAGVTTIEANTFYDCTALTAVTIPAGVTTIDMWAFSGCTALTTVTIPASVTSIAYNAFSNCSALTTVNVPCTWDGSLYTFDEGVTVNKVHNWTNGTCTVCGEPCDHKDSTHTTATDNGDGTHSFECSVCVNTVIEDHTGGTATCTEQAECQHCGASYGELADHSTSYSADGMTITYKCATCDTQTVTFTLVIPTGAVYGGALEVPHYDSSDKTYQGDYPEITLDGALLKDFVPGAKTYEVVMTWGGKTVSGEYTIAKADVGITAPTPNTLTYTGEAQYLISAGEAVGGTMVYSLTEDGEYTTSIPQGTNAGDYKVWYYVQGDANHKDSAKDSVAVTIEKATVTVTADAKSKPYGTDNPTLTYTSKGLLGDDVLTGALETTATKTSNVGEYDITVGSLANSNYTIDFDGAKLTITKADSSCTAPVAVSGLTFNGGNQNLITAGTATGGTMQYSLDGSNWSETIPTGKDADTYTVYYKVVGDGNHNDADGGSLSVTIAPKVITNPVIEGIDAQYLHTGSAITPVPTAVKDGNTVIDPSEYTLTYENNINEGTATLKIVDAANGNYTVSGSKTFQIVVHAHVWNYSVSGNTITATCNGNFGTCPDAEQSFTLNAPDVGYSGNPVEAEVTRDGTDLTFTLHYTGINYDSADAPTNAGDYTVTMTVGDKSVSDTFTISPKDISKVASCQFSLTQISFVYSGKAPVLNVTGVDSSVSSYTMQEGTDYTVGIVQVNAGSHKLTVTGIGNYTGTVELDYTITAKEVSIIDAAIQSVTYDPNGYTLTVTGVTFDGVVDGETLAYTAEAILGNTNACGEQDATVTVTLNNSNYNLVTATYQTKVTINKAAATVTAAPTPNDLTYTGVAQNLINGGEATGGEMQYSTDNQTWSTTIPKGTAAGEYTVYYKVVGDANHSDTAVESVEVTIDKAQAVITVDTTTITVTYGETVSLPTATTNFGTVVCDKTADDLVNAGTYTVTYTVAGTENFEGATKTLTVKVEQLAVAEPTVTGTYTYTGKELTAQLTGVESYMTVASGNKGTNAGNYEVEVTLDGNHKWADGSDGRLQWTIAKAKAEISVNTDSITVTYGETVTLPTATTNFGDVVCNKKASDLVNAGTYTVTYTVAGTDNYTGDTKSVTVIVNAKAITVTADALSKTFGDADPKLTYKVEGLVNGDELTGELKRVAGENVGSYAIEQNTLTAGDNYTITYTGANLTINAKAITEADVELNGSLTYTGKELTQPITVTEGITYTVIGDKATNVGTYVLTVQGTGNYTGEVKLNWSIKETAAVVTKAPAAKTLTYTGTAQNLVNAGSANGGTMVYSLSENGQYTETIPTGANAGEYTVWYYVQGDANHSDTAKASIKVMIHRASATFEITNNVVLEGTEIKLTVTSEPANVSHEVSYRQDGKSVAVPAAVGEYDVYVTITDSNYRHATSTDGSALKVGVLSIYKEETPETYTLSYAAGGATGTMAAEQAALAGTVRILPESTFTAPKDENDNAMLFAGWSDGTAVYQPGEKYVQPEQNVTMTAVWQVEEHNISGMVKQYVSLDSTERVNREGVTITLMLGSRQITQTVTDENGNYQFEHCLQGTYNLIAEYEGIKQTIKVVLGHSDQTGQEIDLPAAKTNTAVAVQPGTPAVVVGGMDDMMTKTDDTVFTEEDKDTVEAGGEVEIKMDIKENPAPANKAEIDQKVEDSLNTSATVELYIDLDLTKTVRDANGTEQSSTAITESNVLLENIIFLPGHLQGKDAYHVFRQHGNDVEEMKELPAGTEVKEEGFVVDRTNHTITIYSRKYSTFAIVTSEVFTITFDANGGTVGTSTMETEEKLNTLPTPERSGFKFIGWFTEKTGGTEVDTSTVFTQDTTVYAQWERIGYQIEFPTTDTTGTIKAGGVVEIDGKLVTIDNNGEIWMPATGSKLLVSYKFIENADPHKEYPTAMYAWFLKWEGDTCEAIRIPELDNFMTYKGTSIRVNHSSDGIRFFTAVPVDTLNQAMKGTLLTGELEGYKLVEMGTLYKWAATGTELTVANGAKSYVYGGSAGSNYRQFSKEGSLSWFTGMLTDLPGDAATLAKDILSRPYAVFENADGDQITLYGGSVQRSIYYVALQNKDTWASGTAYDNYVEKIIATVEAAND